MRNEKLSRGMVRSRYGDCIRLVWQIWVKSFHTDLSPNSTRQYWSNGSVLCGWEVKC